MQEFSVLQHIFASNDDLDDRVIVPPGDDMAHLRLDGRDVLVAVDQLVGGRHYIEATTPAEFVGRKAITRSLSDIAAMAGDPRATLVAATLPRSYDEARARTLVDAMRATCRTYRCPLIGGDLAVHSADDHPLVCSVTVLAEPTTAVPITRGSARDGDRLYVTGRLGGSLGDDGMGHHLTFEPRIDLGIELGRCLGSRLHAMIDISDGLGRDAAHIAEQSNMWIEIDLDRVPCRPPAGWEAAVGDGEDYELCFTATGDVPESINGVPITCVGMVLGQPPADPTDRVIGILGDAPVSLSTRGWEHESP